MKRINKVLTETINLDSLYEKLAFSLNQVEEKEDSNLYNIFETGECIFVGSEEFEEWFDRFYDKTYLDREFLSIYLEEKNKYV